jgi:hypothetical protein
LQGQDLYLEAVVDNDTPYQGQQVLYHARLYQAVQGLGPIDYRQPSFTGFWSEQLSEQGEYMVEAAGRNYRVTQLTSVLFPTVVGETVIDPAQVSVPGDFFNRGANLSSQPLMLNVKPLPDNAPPDFQGAVGRFDIQATVDKGETKVNDTVNWQIVLGGQGNIESLADPVWNEGQAWRAFDSQAEVDSRFENGLLVGSRTYDRVLVPTEAGRLTLPAVSYSYFDPASGQYLTIETEPLAINVMPDGGIQASAPALPAGGSSALAAPTTGIPGQLQPMKEAPTSWSTGDPWLTSKAGFWLLWLVPAALLVGHFGWQRHKQRRLNDVSSRRSKRAAGKARDALRTVRQSGVEADQQIGGQILITYLSEKLDRSLTGMTQKSVAELLEGRGLDAALVQRVERSLILSDMGRYAPAGLSQAGNDLLTETESLIIDLEEVL